MSFRQHRQFKFITTDKRQSKFHFSIPPSNLRTAPARSTSDSGNWASILSAAAKSESTESGDTSALPSFIQEEASEPGFRCFFGSLVQALVQAALLLAVSSDRLSLRTVDSCVRNAEVGGSTPLRSTSCSFDSIVVLNGPSPTSVTGRRFFESMLSRKVGVPVFHEELRDWHFFQDWGRELGSGVYRYAPFPLEGDYPHEVVKLFQARSRFEKRGL